MPPTDQELPSLTGLMESGASGTPLGERWQKNVDGKHLTGIAVWYQNPRWGGLTSPGMLRLQAEWEWVPIISALDLEPHLCKHREKQDTE